jgi:dienelactone hydrolase
LRQVAGLAAVTLLFAAPLPAHAHIVPLADMLNGIHMTPQQCAAIPQTVWVGANGREFCMRYYLSTEGGEGSRPVVFLQGDKFGKLNMRTGEFALKPTDKDVDTDNLVKTANSMSRQFKGPAIYLARVGVDGSSGNHRIRHTVLELNATNAALEAIKQRHGFDGFHLVGQSGGSALVGGMLALRSDIGCAVIGAGRLAADKPPRPMPDPAREYFNVADAVGIIAQKRDTRILLVTDPEDKKVPERTQTNFVQQLRQAGGQAEQFIVQATDDNRHGVVGYSRIATAGCLRGASNEDIAERLRQQVEKRLNAKAASQPTQPDNR